MCFSVAPLTNEMNADASNSVGDGGTKTITCDIDIANPSSDIIWRRAGVDVSSDAVDVTSAGLYGGERLQSTYSFTVALADDSTSISCTPIWLSTELGHLSKTVTLGESL